jgi:23S rRNA pseudouridine1911/1915/1917 synthase
MRRVFEVDRGDARLRLDRLLVARLPEAAGWSRTRLAAWIREGRVAVDGVPATRAAQRLRPGQAVALELPDRPSAAHAAEDRPLTILYEDDALLAIDKPSGLVVHPTRRHPSGTLMNALLWHLGGQGGEARAGDNGGGRPRVHLVHRLDRETSGVLLVAKTPEVHRRLARAMARRAVRKEYLAVVYGVPRAARDRIDLRIRRDPETGRLMTSRHDGLSASTEVEVIATCPGQLAPGTLPRATCPGHSTPGNLTLLRCTLITGRLHQIRVHLAGVGLPLVGDPVYGEPRWKGIVDPAIREACERFPRQALHAWRVQLAHPETGAPLTIVAPPPADLQALLDAAGLEPGTEPYGRAKAT